MTPDISTPRSTRDGDGRTPRTRLVAPAVLAVAALVAVTLAVVVGGTAAVAAQDGPAVRVPGTSVDPGETATVRVVLTSAPEGLAGYELVLSLETDGVAAFAGAEYADAFGLTTDPAVGEDGRTVRLEAADVGGNVRPGASNVTLATVELRGVSAGETALEVRPVQFDADGGTPMNVGTDAGVVAVGEPVPTASPTHDPGTTPDDGAATAPADGSASSASGAAGRTGTPTLTSTTSGQGGLPLAGLGVAALAVGLVAALLARRP